MATTAAFIIALLLFTGAVDPHWGWFVVLTLLGVAAVFEQWAGGLILAVLAVSLATGAFEASLAWRVALFALTAVLLVRTLLHDSRSWLDHYFWPTAH